MADKFRSDFHQLKQSYPMLGVRTWNEVLYRFSTGGNVHLMNELFKEMQGDSVVPNKRTYNHLMRAAAYAGDVPHAISIMKEMKQQGMTPDLGTHAACMLLFSRRHDLDRCRQVVHTAIREGFQPEPFMLNNMVHACTRYSDAMECIAEFKKYRIHPTEITYSGLLQACSFHGEHAHADRVMRKALSDVNTKVDQELYTRYVQAMKGSGDHSKVRSAFNMMQDAGFMPDARAYSYFLVSCLNGTKEKHDVCMEEAKAAFQHIVSQGMAETPHVTNMVSIYAKYGMVEEVEGLRDHLCATMQRGETAEFFAAVQQAYRVAGRHAEAERLSLRIPPSKMRMKSTAGSFSSEKKEPIERAKPPLLSFPERFHQKSGYHVMPRAPSPSHGK
eukprot:TRINITY_DN1668_c1_g1_i1.p1 TRINITY_DN1668_c1_g1~~TRINITY_DN1668_c1_g1_i1.p1  ORF type:complete len:446 (+),score=124.64 TRINITY_DN1668_c1_g1_i1:178-1338(+)